MSRRGVSSGGDMLLYFLAILLPPIPVMLKVGKSYICDDALKHRIRSVLIPDATIGCGCDVLINVLLCCLGWLPGIIHSWWIISRYTTPAVRY